VTAIRYGHCLLEWLQCVDLAHCPPLAREVHRSSTLPFALLQRSAYICGLNRGTVQVCCPRNSVVYPTPKPRDKQTMQATFIVRHRNFNLINRNCGVGLPNRIVGGQNAQPGEFPWLAILQYNGKRRCSHLRVYYQVEIYSYLVSEYTHKVYRLML
jgi:hypothetical protein